MWDYGKGFFGVKMPVTKDTVTFWLSGNKKSDDAPSDSIDIKPGWYCCDML